MRLAHCYQSTGKIAECRTVLKNLKEATGSESVGMQVMEGGLLLMENKPKEATEIFEAIEKEHVGARVGLQLGKSYLLLKNWKKAEAAFRKELEHDPEMQVPGTD